MRTQVVIVCGILTAKAGVGLAALTLGTLTTYVGFTVAITQVRRSFCAATWSAAVHQLLPIARERTSRG